MAPKIKLNSYGQTLKLLRNTARLSQEELAEKSDLDRTYISMLERDIKSPTLQTMLSICDALEISIEKFTSQMTNVNLKEISKKEIKLPLMGTRVACGTPVGEDHFIEKEMSLEKLIIKHPTETFFVQASGDSMSPLIQNHDYLVIDKSLPLKNGHIILAQVENEFTVKRYVVEGKKIILKAENPIFDRLELNESTKFVYCGTVISIVKNSFL
jgi:DNA polymerase V